MEPDDPLWALLASADPTAPADPTGRPGPAADVAADLAAARVAADLAADPLADLIAAAVAVELARRDVAPAALAVPGRVVLGRTHLDVLLPIERIDLAVRVSGLDRDPGWVPALARVVSFHFGEHR